MKNLIKLLLFGTLLVACSSSDDDGSIVVGGPTNGGGSGGGSTSGPEAGGDEIIDGFTYKPTDIAKNIVSYPVGNIVSASKLSSTSSDNQIFKAILNEEYNSITAENDMKMSAMFDGPGDYDYEAGDAIVAYAKANGLRVHGHVLAWHKQQPAWLGTFSGTDEEFETAVLDYITNTVSHFAQEKMTVNDVEVPVVASWDVVNETFESGATDNVLYQKIDDFVAKAFQAARAGDPDVKLFYNDYGIAGDPGKRNSIITMVNDFKSRSIPIDGIGMQMHLNHNWPDTDLPTSIQDIADTGLLVHISELDVKVNYEEDITELTKDRAAEQEAQFQRAAYYYHTLVPAAQQHGITIWGFRDQDSWLYDNNTDWPLLYDNDFNYKVSHRGFINGLKGQAP
ncbi:endo-1,4-beta-xylanase [Abyssalbus ytuae]|uniref:Beta-xylanase n=1 Tax=Abyssalbus ytuae TaxID=2926907 RepID=A0A9E6ZRE3_9FLAO|nr:endo-1,4-beta-xylanase [Abyssalbus ytuae]UOB19100.1 endo-1,4-beta-xylanase [Abyssalbus ytuae]